MKWIVLAAAAVAAAVFFLAKMAYEVIADKAYDEAQRRIDEYFEELSDELKRASGKGKDDGK